MSTQINSSICSSSTVCVGSLSFLHNSWVKRFHCQRQVIPKIDNGFSNPRHNSSLSASMPPVTSPAWVVSTSISSQSTSLAKWSLLERYQPRYTYKRMVESYEESLHWSLVVLVNRPDSCPVALMANARVKRWLKLKSTEWRSVVSRTWLWDPGKKCQKLWSQKSFWANCIYFTNPNWSNAFLAGNLLNIRDLTAEITLIHLDVIFKKSKASKSNPNYTLHCIAKYRITRYITT